MSDEEDEYAQKEIKIVLVGDSAVGKTNICTRFCYNDFSRQYTPTAGIDLFMKNLCLGSYKNVTIYFRDLSGLSLRSPMLDKYLYNIDIIFLVYDVTNSSSFDILEEWITAIREVSDNPEDPPMMVVVGNKCDMEHQRTVKREKSHRFAAENGFPYYDVSARTGETISVCIVHLAAQKLGIKLTKTDLDYHRPIVTAEIGDSVDMPVLKDQKIVKRQPNKKNLSIHNFRKSLSTSKSSVCALQ